MKVRTLVARHPGGAITPKNDWRLYAENVVAPLRWKSGGAITPKTKWLLYAGNSQVLRSWLRERQGKPLEPVFPTTRGNALSHDALQYMLDKHLRIACQHCPSLVHKRVTPHTLRHTLAMDLLHHGAEQTVIALWLGHESPETTSVYLHADMQLKERALAKTSARKTPVSRYRPDDRVMRFLKSL